MEISTEVSLNKLVLEQAIKTMNVKCEICKDKLKRNRFVKSQKSKKKKKTFTRTLNMQRRDNIFCDIKQELLPLINT